MLVVAIASQKGGSGKTTLAGHLAVEAEKAGAGPVALIDTDPQGSLSQWWNARAAGTPKFAKVGVYELTSALQHLKRTGIKLVMIDTPPAISESISQVIGQSDLVILPTRPSPHDLRAVGATVDIAEKHKKPVIFVMNGATARARITGESAIALSQHGTVAPTTIHHRVDFAASMIDGRTVGEVVPRSQSTKEISDLWIYLQDRLARIAQDPAMAPSPEARPHLALTPLSADLDEEGAELPEAAAETDLPPPVVKPADIKVVPLPPPVEELPYLGPDRRMMKDRRDPPPPPVRAGGGGFFSGPDRRVANPFGRRHSDQG
jgi:chromosome partitioning protein